jgi:hypothetical protein
MMGYRAPSKKAIKDAIKQYKDAQGVIVPQLLAFEENVQETSFFGFEARVPGENTVVGPDAYTNRKWFATLTVNESGIVTGVR